MKLLIVITLLVNCVIATVDEFHSDLGDSTAEFGHLGLIVNGEKAKPKQFPYIVSLAVEIDNETTIGLCGGSLISNQWILTAAHCTEILDYGFDYIFAHLGALNRTDTSETGHKVIRVPNENVFKHEDYDPKKIVNDLALLKLPNPVELNDYIQPVQLPKMGESSTYAGKKAIASGWGKTRDDDKKGSDILLWIEVPIMDNVKCKKKFEILQASHICFDTTGKKSACQGDSGGPLVLADGSKTLIGVTSFGGDSCEIEYPAVYVRITSYLDWIKKNSGISNE